MDIVYRSIADMNEAILRNLHKIPHDVDLVVGIPRSGMLPANLIALYLNKPFTDLDSFIEGRIYATGERGSYDNSSANHKVLIMDDSIHSGSALSKAKLKLKNIIEENRYTLLFGVVYSIEKSMHLVDFYCEVTPELRFFQWNIFHHGYFVKNAFFDIDGVLCPNPPIDDDGELYIKYISNAPILYRPTVEIDTLITCRLEKYREITEKWLAENDFKYKRLIMLNLPSKQARLKWAKHGKYKGEQYKQSSAIIFIESSLHEAIDIVSVAKKPVFCIETMNLMNYTEPRWKKHLRKYYWKIKVIIKNILKRFAMTKK